MKTIIFALAASALVLVGCNNKDKELTAQYDVLVMQQDSLATISAANKSAHQEMVAMHQVMTEKLNAMETKDSSLMVTMAEHEVIFKNHEAIIAGQDAMIAGNNELKEKFATLTAEEKEAQIALIIENQNTMIEQNETLKAEHEQLMAKHQDVMAKVQAPVVTEEDEKMMQQ
ncbi:MAG: hypothetical protein CMC08_02535 [Flavobacteriaceae bacterium]|nr:hypothetical protein [Flavobacteriaceae bacterium]